ncbi:terpene cyclase [Penicillium antarcticum]|uniref:terpene cyclase n=1 Tax=Penicillium antarcticum TaxID=416450 RepID=UPI002384EFD3|nr:terpene cyclase [Penicillium antarcticum]KAJ5320443.1 terpene cyclase [Penicillium antarcticum]
MGNILQKEATPPSVPAGPDEEQGSCITVRLQDLFVLFLSEKPIVNQHYAKVRKESEAWISKQCSFNEQMSRIITKTNFSYFISISVPYANPEELRTCCDWGNWVFPFDDKFDNGSLRDNPVESQKIIDCLLFRMKEGNELSQEFEKDPLLQVHNSVWERIFRSILALTIKPSIPFIGVQRRFAKAMAEYAHGTISQVKNTALNEHPSLEEVLALRRESAGVSPLFSLVEYAHRLDLPDEVFECHSIKEINRIGVDFVVLQNDILSYCKEEVSIYNPAIILFGANGSIQKEGVEHNMVAVCRNSGMRAQEAFDCIGGMLTIRYRDWYLALADLPSWGRDIDAEVQKYIRGVRNVVQANLHWSFSSGRYFGDAVEEVRRTMMVKVQERSADKPEAGK